MNSSVPIFTFLSQSLSENRHALAVQKLLLQFLVIVFPLVEVIEFIAGRSGGRLLFWGGSLFILLVPDIQLSDVIYMFDSVFVPVL